MDTCTHVHMDTCTHAHMHMQGVLEAARGIYDILEKTNIGDLVVNEVSIEEPHSIMMYLKTKCHRVTG